MKHSRKRAIRLRLREAAFRRRMGKFIKQLKRGDIPQLRSRDDDACPHEWELDGQTLQSVRWTCRLCGVSQFG